MSRWSCDAIRHAVCVGLALVAGSAVAQIPERFTNLKVLPPDIKSDALVSIMGGFTRALGVNCAHCHVAADGRRPTSAEFALDSKETKQVARTMLRMVDEINNRHLPETGRARAKLQRVSCTTCHGGLTRPRPLEAVLVDSYAEGGVDAAVKRYRELRRELFGRRAYDFSDITLVSAASEIASGPKNLPDALALMRLNLEFHPDSWFTYQEQGRLQERAGDTAGALASYRQALEINPTRAFVRELLEALEVKQKARQ